MARKLRSPPKPTGTPLPAVWRTSTWQVPPMLAKIPPSDYEATARAFERASATALSDDWPGQWRAWCRNILVTREPEKPFGSDLFG